jgi:hypothetical protein
MFHQRGGRQLDAAAARYVALLGRYFDLGENSP